MLPLIDDGIQSGHLSLIDAVERRDKAGAARVLLHHIQEMKQRIIDNYVRDHLH